MKCSSICFWSPYAVDARRQAAWLNVAVTLCLILSIWSYVSTTTICAWTSLHPNVPPLNKWNARWNRLRLTFWMIVAPEFVLGPLDNFLLQGRYEIRTMKGIHVSMVQWGAEKLTNMRPDLPEWKKWTLTHHAWPFIRYGRVHSHRSGS